ncbi:MAG: choice-of-anchor B family protein [Bacteroidia bacterium]|nr:choice-of-anchor B family protein [Bacteroidia bacterium]
MTKTTIFLLTGLLSFSPVAAQLQKNVTLVSHLPYTAELNDIWGYTDSLGNEYALVGLTNGVSIVDISTPSQPVEAQFVPGPISPWRDLQTFDHYAYISNETGSGILIIDLSGLPNNVVYKDTTIGAIATAHNVWVSDNGFLYVIGYNKSGGFKVFDLNGDPWNPVYLGDYQFHYVHDLYSRQNTVYASELSFGLTLIDMSNPALPQVIANHDYPRAFTHNSWLNDNGNVCFTTDEVAAAYLTAWEVNDPSDIRFLDRIRSSVNQGRAAPHNVHVLNDYLVTSYYADGLNIVDASRPENLVEVGYYDTSPKTSGLFEGAWGAYPFLSSGLVLIADIEEGLFVLQPQYRRGCYLEGKVTDAQTTAPVSNVGIEGFPDSLEEFSLTTGDYAIGVADSGAYTVIFSKYGYESDTFPVVLDNGQLTVLDVALTPLPRTPLKIKILDSQTLQPVAGTQVQAIAPDNAAVFDYLTGFNGQITDNRFVINTYDFIIGKWGYITQDTSIMITPGNDSLVVFLTPGYYDDFALDFEWEVEGTAERGIWERGEPIGTYREDSSIYNPEYDLPDDIGPQAYLTGNAGGAPFGDDVDNGYTFLISPPINLSAYSEPVLQYHWWFLNWSLNGSNPDGPGNDFLTVSVTDGLDTVELRRYTGPFDTTWNAEVSIPFVNVINRNLPVRFLFYTQDLEPGNQDAVEAAIDGFRIVEASSVGLENPDFADVSLNVYPVPAQDFVEIDYQLPAGNLQWEINLVNIKGQKLICQPIENPSGKLRMEFSLPGGIYFLTVENDGKTVFSRKILIRR